MKILLTTNKTYRGFPDTGHWYTYKPLQELGHEVYWYATVDPVEKDYDKIIEEFKPDLIFCCMTNNRYITPYEPWESVKKETDSGRTKTFNWFCDDTWRFDKFSSGACHYFNVSSTPDPNFIEKYKSVGYDNIIIGMWHANSDFYPKIKFKDKNIDISFIGAATPSRKLIFEHAEVPIKNIFGIPMKDVFLKHSQSKIGINFSANDNDPLHQTQIKQRIFEISAGAGMVLTQYHQGIEEFFEIDQEIITFETIPEFVSKSNFFLENIKIAEKIASNGYKRFLAEHDSKIRLNKLLQQIKEL